MTDEKSTEVGKEKWKDIADVKVGLKYGHVPGNNFHDVYAMLLQKGNRYRVDLVEQRGSCQGRDELHDEKVVSGYGDTIEDACEVAEERAQMADMEMEYVVQAIDKLRREAL